MSEQKPKECYVYQPEPHGGKRIYAIGGPGSEQFQGERYTKEEATLLAEAINARSKDWRIGLSCKPKYRHHELWFEEGKIRQVYPSGFGNIIDPDGVLMIEMENGCVFLDKADNWVTR